MNYHKTKDELDTILVRIDDEKLAAVVKRMSKEIDNMRQVREDLGSVSGRISTLELNKDIQE